MLLIAHVYYQDGNVEAEPVTVVAYDDSAWLVLDDGTALALDARELRVALDTDVLAEEAA